MLGRIPRRARIAGLGVGPTVVVVAAYLAVAGWYTLSPVLSLAFESRELPFRRTQFARIAGLVTSGKLRPDTIGLVGLPRALAPDARDGVVCVTKVPGRKPLVLVPVWRGKGMNMVGYLHSADARNTVDMRKK